MYANPREVIFIAIIDFIMFPEKAVYFSKHTIRDTNTNQHDLRDFAFILSNSINANVKSLKSCSFVIVSRIVCFENKLLSLET